MSDNAAAPSKLCAGCSTDVTSKPRVKTATGEYFCRDCAAKKQAALTQKLKQAAPPPAPEADVEMMSRLIDDSAAKGANACPACRRPWKESASICTHCGFNKETGRMLGTHVQKPDKGPSAAAQAASAGLAPVFAAVGATVGGLVGAGIWAGVAYQMHVEVGYIAWVVGGLTGLGAAIGARHHAGILSGMIAVIAAVASILLAKFMFVAWILADAGVDTSEVSAQAGITATLSMHDIIFFLLAIVTAAGVGSKGQISFSS